MQTDQCEFSSELNGCDFHLAILNEVASVCVPAVRTSNLTYNLDCLIGS